MNPKVDIYFATGCGRCPLGNTPECKVHYWTEELRKLRQFVLNCGLEEELKWGVPVFTFEKNNVVMLSAFKNYCTISFFKGVLLKDTYKILTKPGENSQAARIIKFTDVRKITELETVLKNYVYEAIQIEKSGLKPHFKKTEDFLIPEELKSKFDNDPALRAAFNALTPGRQRGYILHFSQPKQSKTRVARIEKYAPHILKGKGLNDDY